MIDFVQHKHGPYVAPSDMKTAYETLRTPVRLGPVVKLDDYFADSPTVFRYQGRWYMLFIEISKNTGSSGYETHLAASDDLVHWGYVGKLLRRDGSRVWDSKQIAAYSALSDIGLFGSYAPLSLDGRYFVTYLAGALDGYETDTMFMGLASSTDPLCAEKYIRSERPILTQFDADCRPFETKTLYKSFVFEDRDRVSGHRFVNCYNAKGDDGRERIFLAVSDDMEVWSRYGDRAVIDDVTGDQLGHISGDPQIIRLGEMYVMVYFRFHGKSGAYDTFAASYDLVNWTKWAGEPLIAPSDKLPDENVHAHKPWIVGHDGVVYHFYCAVNSRGERYIALAVSENYNR